MAELLERIKQDVLNFECHCGECRKCKVLKN